MKYITHIILVIWTLVGISCNTDEGCRKDKYVKMQLGIYHVTHNATTNVNTATYLNVDSITVKGIGVDSVIYNNTKNIHSITLPLNKQTEESKFQVTINSTTDTITILHTNYNTYLSLECGCIKTHTIDAVLTTNHFIDSASIIIHDVNTSTSAKEHIKLYN